MSELPNLSLFPPGHGTVRVAEKSNISQTCNLLSQYLIKEKRNFNDHLNLGITSTTSIVLEEEEEEEDMKEKSESVKMKSMDLFPQNSGFGPSSTSVSVSVSVSKEDDDDMIISTNNNKQQQQQQADDDFSEIRSVKLEPESSTAPMTIFYGGKVLVFNNITVTKAKQIFNFAAANNTTNTNAILSSSHSVTPPNTTTTTGNNNNNNLNNSGTVIPSVISSASNLAPALTTTTAAAAAGMMMINSKQQNFKAPKLSDLPIQRKASLHRFLEKRKDRINARTPYNNKSTESVADKILQKEDKEESKFCLISLAN